MEYVLAMYDVRGKQDFIFRTNKLKEIAGASWMIRDCFQDYLFPAAQKISKKGIFTYKNPDGSEKSDAAFSVGSFKKRMEEGYIGEVVYDGGGNFLLLFRDEETFRKVTYQFTRDLMEEIGTLRVLGSCVPVSDFSDYRADSAALYAKHRKHEMQESMISPWSCLPIVQVDRASTQPLVPLDRKDQRFWQLGSEERSAKHSKESWQKIFKYQEEMERIKKHQKEMERVKNPQKTLAGGELESGQSESAESNPIDEAGRSAAEDTVVGLAAYQFSLNEKIFDRLVPKKGEDSQLAVIYIDGNGMGARVEKIQEKYSSYEEYIREIRIFSAEIQQKYVENGIAAVMSGQEENQEHRIVVYAGDEVNFVVPAKDALECAKRYLQTMRSDEKDAKDSACAGIAVFHSHFPYSEAYRIAEECCESAKKRMKKENLGTACLIDWHIIQGAAGISLQEMRRQENGEIISRPWLYSVSPDEKVKAESITTLTEVERLRCMFNKLGRGNIKNLAELANRSATELNLDLLRIRAHQCKADRDVMKEDWDWLLKMDEQKKRSLIYDVVRTYDFWFGGEEGTNKGEAEGRANE